MKKTIVVLGKVKTNKNGTNYIDTADGRVFLGKTSGFKTGDDISGEAICDPIDISYPEVAAANGRPAVPARTEKAWQAQNFLSDEMLTKQTVNQTIRAEAKFKLAVVNTKTAAVATMETVDLFNIPA